MELQSGTKLALNAWVRSKT